MNYKDNKELLVERAKSHRSADTIVQGEYWNGSKGCCVGCLSETSDKPHEKLAELVGAPEWLFRLADTIHEGLTKSDSKDWVVQFAEALSTTPDDNQFWKDTKSHWKIACMHECLRNKDFWFENDKDDVYASKVVAVLELVKELANKELSGEEVDWSDAESAARSAAWSAARSAARSAADSAARSAARSAADSADFAARSAARSAAWSVRIAAKSAAYKRLSEELITILRREEEEQ